MVTHRPFDDQGHLNISSRLQRCIAQCSVHRLPTRAVLHQIRHRGVSPFGMPYAEVKVIDPSGQQHHALATEQHFGDLAQLEKWAGQEIGLKSTRHGLEVLAPGQEPASDQPSGGSSRDVDSDAPEMPAFQQSLARSASLEEVVSTVARISRELKLPTACWIHLP
jgi:hypothetical protein